MRMKLMFLLLCIIGTVQAQEYVPMLSEDHRWNIEYVDPLSQNEWYTLRVVDEVTIFGHVYKKFIINNNSTGCFMREENGIVYLYDSVWNEEFIYFDFTLELGDFFDYPNTCVFGGSDFIDEIEVVEVSTMIIEGTPRKTLGFATEFSGGAVIETWIEGVGSSMSGLEPGGNYIDTWLKLNCFVVNGNTYFFNDATECNFLEVEDLVDLNKIVLYPNPVVNTSILQFPSEGNVDLLKIYDVTGKLVKEEKVNKDYVLIDAMQYPSGLYFYQVFSENKLLKTEKFIIK